MSDSNLQSEVQNPSDSITTRINDRRLTQALTQIYSNKNLALNVRSFTADVTLDVSDSIAICNGTFNVTLPPANSWGTRNTTKSPILQIVNVGTGAITVLAASGDTIGGTSTVGGGTSIVLVSNGSNTWYSFAVGNISGVFVLKAGDTMSGDLTSPNFHATGTVTTGFVEAADDTNGLRLIGNRTTGTGHYSAITINPAGATNQIIISGYDGFSQGTLTIVSSGGINPSTLTWTGGTATFNSTVKLQTGFGAATVGSTGDVLVMGTGGWGGGITMQDTNYAGFYCQNSGETMQIYTNQTSAQAASSNIRFTIGSTLLTYYTALAKGSAPEKSEPLGTIAQTATSICLKDGSTGSPRTDTTYNTPMIYLERHTNNPTTTTYANWSNVVLQPMLVLEGVAYGNEAGNVTGVAARISSAFPRTATPQPLQAFAGQCYSNASTGTHRDMWAGNFIADFDNLGAAKPTNLVGIEADILPGISSSTTKPGVVGADNFTAFWAQTDGRGASIKANTAFYATGTGTGGWHYGLLMDAIDTAMITSNGTTCVSGVDWSTCTFSGNAWASPGITISGAGAIASSSSIKSSSASAGVGYATGAGGTVTQLTNKGTSVTLNKMSGQITMNNAALAAGAKVSFFCNNSNLAATDIPVVAVVGGGTTGAYRADVTLVAATTFLITVENITGGSLSESPIIGFAIIKGVTA